MIFHKNGLVVGSFDFFDSLSREDKLYLDKSWQHCQDLIIGLYSDTYLLRSRLNPVSDELTRYQQLIDYGEVVIFDGDVVPIINYYNISLIISPNKGSISDEMLKSGKEILNLNLSSSDPSL